MTQAGAGIFVKTIGMSPLKTRLAAGIGEDKAHEFYRYSCRAVYEVLSCLPEVTPYWAVAEGKSAYEKWDGYKMEQGSGALGDRLAFVYEHLLEQHRFAILLGGDAPQISPNLIQKAIDLGRDGSFVIGPSLDGGFYLLLGSKSVSRSLWRNVPYSQEHTREILIEELEQLGGSIKFLEMRGDVDVVEDIPGVLGDLKQLVDVNTAQVALVGWLESQI